MTDADTVIRTLSALAAAALRRGARQDEAELAAVLAWLPEGACTPEAVEAALRDALRGVGAGELAAAIRDTPILVEDHRFDESVGAFVAMAMLPDELAEVLLDKASSAMGEEGGADHG